MTQLASMAATAWALFRPAPAGKEAAQRSIFASPVSDYALVLMPFWTGGLYLAAVTAFPDYRPLIFFLCLAVLGESHFAATWLFFLGRENRQWAWQRRWILIYGPVAVTSAYAVLGCISLDTAFLVGGLASGIHVTRQSIGIYRLYGGPRKDIGERAIYAASFGFIAIGFARFYAPKLSLPPFLIDEMASLLLPLSLTFIGWVIVYLIRAALRLRNARHALAVLTGAAIYFPYCFVQVPQDAVAIGVAMHWCQYLAINYAVYARHAPARSSKPGTSQLWLVILSITAYALVMAAIGTAGGTSLRPNSSWVLIPLCGQLIHYYVDAFIWRFSDPHIRKNVGRFLWAS